MFHVFLGTLEQNLISLINIIVNAFMLRSAIVQNKLNYLQYYTQMYSLKYLLMILVPA